MFKSTAQHKKFWETREVNWKADYFDTFNHPHRDLIIEVLRKIRFGSLLEVGCASGPNLYRISKEFPRVAIGGIDVSPAAIAAAENLLPKTAVLDVGSVENMFYSDKSIDVLLTDAALIYVSPLDIRKALREIKRVARNNIVLVEFYSPRWWERLALSWSYMSYHAHNYPKLLEAEGFFDIEVTKIPHEKWPCFTWSRWGHIITAKI